MPAITVKNIPTDLYDQIKKSASSNYRSINGEILYRLQFSLGHKPVEHEKLITKITLLRNQLNAPEITDEFLEMAKNEGRP